jgi:hypothetical protein
LPETEIKLPEFTIADSSSAMLQQTPPPRQEASAKRIPFDALPVGKSVAIPFADYSEVALRALIARKNKELAPKRFDLIRWPGLGVYELGRVE